MQHGLEQSIALGAATPQQHPIRMLQPVGQIAGQQLQRIVFDHGAGSHVEPLGIGLDEGGPTGPTFHRQQLELGPQPKGLQADAAGTGAEIPQHPLIRQLQIRQQLDACLPLGHQSGVIRVLEVQPILETEQRQRSTAWHGRLFSNQHHHQQGLQWLRQRSIRRDPQHPFVGMAEVFPQPELIAGLQTAAAQASAHGIGAAALGIGEHRQGPGSPLQLLGQRFRIASMQAQPTGVLPGTTDAGKGQLQAGGGGMKAQPFRPEPVRQDAADAEPERVSAGQHHHVDRFGKVVQNLRQMAGIVAVDQWNRAVQPGFEGRLKASWCGDLLGSSDQGLQRCRQ